MNANPIFTKALLLLTHPASLLALAGLALNDFVLKAAAPSWLTGKLSDFCLLFLLPFLLLAGTGWAAPARWQERAAASVFTGVAAAFGLLKLVPAAGYVLHDLTVWLGLAIYTRPDPSDLLALVVLIPAWKLWQQPVHSSQWKRALAVLPLAAALTLADAAAPDYGITCFNLEGGQITASTIYGRQFTSGDGGLTWQAASQQGEPFHCTDTAGEGQALMSQPDGQVQYRYQSGGAIERTADGGSTWNVEYTPQHLNQVRKAYAEKTVESNISYKPGPLSAMEDPATGNVLFAMGIEGVLVRTSAGEYVWSDVGKYARPPVERVPVDGYLTLLAGEAFLAVLTAALSFSTMMVAEHRMRALRMIKVGLGWMGWLGVLLVFPPALMAGAYSGSIVWTSLLILGLYALISLLDDLISLARNRARGGWTAAGFGLLSVLGLLLPFVLWAAEVLPEYKLAAGLGIGLVALCLVAGFIKLRSRAVPVETNLRTGQSG